MTQFTLDLSSARAMLLAAQGMLTLPDQPADKPAVLEAIRRMGTLQIDTISVIARSPYMVLYTRLGDYQPAWLEELLAEGSIYEYWSHEACFLPREDYPLSRRLMLEGRKGWYTAAHWIENHRPLVDRIMNHIQENGEVKSSDFERTDGKTTNWWNWKDEKLALEVLYTHGDLMIARRQRFQRVYNLRQRIRPDWRDEDAPAYEQVRDELILKAVKAMGVAQADWVADYFRQPKREVPPRLEELANEGRLLKGKVEGLKNSSYIHPEHHALLEQAARGALKPTGTFLLSPFDPVVWDRKRMRALFNFEYTIECYTPPAKRKYGYYILPILQDGSLIGRLDAKAHRKDGIFEVKAVYLEPGVLPNNGLITGLADALTRCARWHATPQVVVRQSDPPELSEKLQSLVAQAV